MQEFTKRLALGTAQLGMAYGINNVDGQPSLTQAAQILQAAQAAGLDMLDTAAAYGESEARLGQLLPLLGADFALVTKLGAGPAAEVTTRLQEALRRLGRGAVYGLLFHDFAGQQQWPAAWQALRRARDQGQAQRIGVSLYQPWQAEWLLEKQLPVSLVQIPFSVLDQRFGPLLPILAAAGVEVHVRSAFLQGLLLREPASLPAFFSPLRGKLTALRRLAAASQMPLQALLLLFAATAPHVARVVIGVDTVENLRENVQAGQYLAGLESIRPVLATFAEADDTFILPYTWPR